MQLCATEATRAACHMSQHSRRSKPHSSDIRTQAGGMQSNTDKLHAVSSLH